jgi:hypothetical protein
MTTLEEIFGCILIIVALALTYTAGKADFLHAMCQIFSEKAKEFEEAVKKAEEETEE